MITKISKGLQVTIPVAIRNNLGLEVGSRLEITEGDGKIILEPIAKNDDLEKMFERTKNIKPKYKMTAEEMDEYNERLFR